MNLHDKDQLGGFTVQDAKVHMEAGDYPKALDMLETLLMCGGVWVSCFRDLGFPKLQILG